MSQTEGEPTSAAETLSTATHQEVALSTSTTNPSTSSSANTEHGASEEQLATQLAMKEQLSHDQLHDHESTKSTSRAREGGDANFTNAHDSKETTTTLNEESKKNDHPQDASPIREDDMTSGKNFDTTTTVSTSVVSSDDVHVLLQDTNPKNHHPETSKESSSSSLSGPTITTNHPPPTTHDHPQVQVAAGLNTSVISILPNTTGTNTTTTAAADTTFSSEHSQQSHKKNFPPAPKATHANNLSVFKSLKNYFLALIYASKAQRQERKHALTKALELFEKATSHMLLTNNNAFDVSVLYFNIGIVWEKMYIERVQQMLNSSQVLIGKQNVGVATMTNLTSRNDPLVSRDMTSQSLSGQHKVEHLIQENENGESNANSLSSSTASEKVNHVSSSITTGSNSEIHHHAALLGQRPSIVGDFEMDDFKGRRTTVSSAGAHLTNVSAEDILAHLESEMEMDIFMEHEQQLTSFYTADDSNVTKMERKNAIKNIFTYYGKSLKLCPTNLEAYFQLAGLYQRVGMYYHAIALYEKTLEIDETFAEGYNSLGVCLFNMGQLDKATYYYSKALKHDLKNPVIFANLGEVLYERGKYAEALNMFSRAFYLAPAFGSLYCYFGLYYFEQEKSKEKALQMFEKALELSPQSPDVYFYFGRFWLENSEYDKALQYFDKASCLVPPNRQMYYYRGLALDKKGDRKESIAMLEKAVTLAPSIHLYRETLDRVVNATEQTTGATTV
ncbi:hypothetical protein C9374_011116 [Naegleria lovaniensis]|uniref:UDP-N-acetylglucosamine--peptide N-acetylglucosaminyltransferase SPINDLY n=1 Tax=Naegleria lovaniensis TaxID=51637 RepID=A0AA88GEB9_NAELO|nr:uncharacterized protein C9374_011116 [Naegleria lovaniensis]KAG2374037.1 hypothetical protein C9374_011116 [Naegleria lovaniensis]